MANYTKATNFTAKDGLPANNSGKIVKGAEIDTEFNAIAAAISSKADSNSPTFTGTPLAPTAAAGTSNTQIATTGFVATERTSEATLTNKTLTSPIINGSGVIFEGSTADDYETTLTVVDPTADNTLTLPNATDTLVGRATTDTLTNKSIALGSNTLTGTKAQFNTAVTDTDIAFLNDFTGSNQSLTGSGYQKLPGGLILQWGEVITTTATVNQTVSFPTTFPTACLFVQTQVIYSGGGFSGAYVEVINKTTTSFTTRYQMSRTWMAIGY